jgi:BASS family bile acid:Na+ symporter
MKYLLPGTVLLLMISIGMSLDWTQFVANWRQLTLANWGKLLVATFIIPPILALTLGNLLRLDQGALIGLFLVAIAPGAPLMTRGVAKRGFDMSLAASYQVWGALLTPVMIPLLVAAAGWLYGRSIWVSPFKVLSVIAKQQFAPLISGMALMRFAPAFSTRIRRALNVIGNGLLLVTLIALLVKMGPALGAVSPWVAIAALLLAAGCIAASFVLLTGGTVTTETLVVCNVNRHVGLALLLSGTYFQKQKALPAIAAYALAAQLMMWLYARLASHGRNRASSDTGAMNSFKRP